MNTRREFLKASGALAASSFLLPALAKAMAPPSYKVGLQLYTLRKEMLENAVGTLKALAKIGYQELESAKSEKGNYYGLTPKQIKAVTRDNGMRLISGHVQIDKDWQRSVDEAAEAGQPYLVVSVLPAEGQTVENYQRSAEIFNKAAEACQKANITFGYHNHITEFDKVGDQVLYDILVERTDAKLVKMEMDIGWVVAAGADPFYYFNKYPGRFPLWHLKDIKKATKESPELGKGDIDIAALFKAAGKSGLQHYFVEQEEYPHTALESCKYDYDYLQKLYKTM